MTSFKTDATIPSNIRPSRAEREARNHYLEQTDGPASPRKFTLDRPEIVIGREEGLDIRVESDRTSRRHAILKRRGVEYTIFDNDSRNGVHLNGLKVHSAVLREGDTIQVGEGVFVYREG